MKEGKGYTFCFNKEQSADILETIKPRYTEGKTLKIKAMSNIK